MTLEQHPTDKMSDVADDLALIVRNAIAYIRDLEGRLAGTIKAVAEANAIMEEVSEETSSAWRERWGHLLAQCPHGVDDGACKECYSGDPFDPFNQPQCNPHPQAPHGFLRNASHTEDRYVCECEYWDPYQAGYDAGFQAALRLEHNA